MIKFRQKERELNKVSGDENERKKMEVVVSKEEGNQVFAEIIEETREKLTAEEEKEDKRGTNENSLSQ